MTTFRETRAFDEAQGLSDLFNVSLHGDDVQDFATRRDRALLATSEIPQENVHEGLFKMLLQGSEKLQTVSAQAMKD